MGKTKRYFQLTTVMAAKQRANAHAVPRMSAKVAAGRPLSCHANISSNEVLGMVQAVRRLRFLLVFALVLASALAFAGDQKLSRIEFVVLRSANGKPVRNASIVIHPVNKKGKQGKGGMQLKTDPDGK